MAKKPKRNPDWPHDYEPYPGSERFGDWDFGENSNVIHQNRDEQLVPDPDNKDPHPLADMPTK
jgi:hypothetical protein